MSQYVTVRMTLAQARAAANACDLIHDQHEADNFKMREGAVYRRACETILTAIKEQDDR